MKNFLDIKIFLVFTLIVTALDESWPIAICAVCLIALWAHSTHLAEIHSKHERSYEKKLKELGDRLDAIQMSVGMKNL